MKKVDKFIRSLLCAFTLNTPDIIFNGFAMQTENRKTKNTKNKL